MRVYKLRTPSNHTHLSALARTQGRKSIDVLSGLALGILADGQINSREASFLKDWISTNAVYLPQFAISNLVPILSEINSGSEVSDETLSDLSLLLNNLVGLDATSKNSNYKDTKGLPSKLIFDEATGEETLYSKEVVLTGSFSNFSKKEAEVKITELGGSVRDGLPTHQTNYVFVGSKGSKAWRNEQLGRKIEYALRLKGEGSNIEILSEIALVDILNSRSTAQSPDIIDFPCAQLPLADKTFVITGSLSMERGKMKSLIESKGGKVSGSISSKTDFLVAGEGGGSKRDKAEKLGVEIIDEETLQKMIQG